jgi:hypothetical protein
MQAWANCTSAPADEEQAQEHLVIATTMYHEMHMQFWLARAEAEMKRSA